MADTVPLRGLRRDRRLGSLAIPTPEMLQSWFMSGQFQTLSAPNSVATSLLRLDEISRTALPGDLLLACVHDVKIQELLGLDQRLPSMRLRMAVQRAFEVSWRYAEAYYDLEESALNVRRLSPKLRKAADALLNDALQIAQALDQWKYRPKQHGQQPLLARAEELIADLIADGEKWSSQMVGEGGVAGPGDTNDDDFPDGWAPLTAFETGEDECPPWLNGVALRPDRFLYLRLAEVFAGSFGKIAPLHHSGNRRKPGGSNSDRYPDEELFEFLQVALGSLNWPKVTQLDVDLRAIRDPGGLVKGALQSLSSLRSQASDFSYTALPSVDCLLSLRLAP